MTIPPPIPAPSTDSGLRPPTSFRKTFRRHWRWAVPLSLVGFLVVAVFAWSIQQTVSRLMRPNPALEGALRTMREAPQAIAALGQPIQSHDSLVSFEERGTSVFAEIEVSVSGPNDSGLLIAEAVKQDGVWRTTKLVLTMEDQSPSIDLLSPTVGESTDSERSTVTR